MPEWLKFAALMIGLLVASVPIMNFVTKRDEKQDRNAEWERERAEKIVGEAGYLVIIIAHLATGFVGFVGGAFCFFIVLDGDGYHRLLETVPIAVIAWICFFWLDRIIRNSRR